MARITKQYVCVVDGYRRPSRRRNTFGRYRVAARDEREAKDLLKKAVGFGSVQVLYEDTDAKGYLILPRGQCRIEMPDGLLRPVRRATDPLGTYEEEDI